MSGKALAQTFGAALVATALAAAPASAQKVLKWIPQGDLKVVDPHWTTATLSQSHGYLVYDVLFALDNTGQPKPQMVESVATSADGLTWSFTLRDGMTFSDGSPVTAQAAVASVKRWAARNASGKILLNATASFEAKDARSFEIKLSRKFALVTRILADPTLPAFIMREKEAATDPFTQVTEVVGSGPFVMAKEEWVPGSKVIYKKNAAYKPRSEPVSGFSGAKVAYVDRVEWTYIPDTATASQALIRGEVDLYESPGYDLIPTLRKDPNVVVRVLDKVGSYGHVRVNQLHPPFNNPKARQALQLLIDQKEFLSAMVGTDLEFGRECYAIFMCGAPLETDAGAAPYRKADVEKAKQLFKEAGYKGEPIVVMHPTDFPLLGNISMIMAERLRIAGLNVQLDAMDWSSIIARRPKTEVPGPGSPGWSLFGTSWSSATMSSPLTNTPLVTTCDRKNWFGWPCDEEIEKLRAEFEKAEDLDSQKRIAAALQARYYEVFPYFNVGQYLAPTAWRKTIVNVPDAVMPVAWGLDKQ